MKQTNRNQSGFSLPELLIALVLGLLLSGIAITIFLGSKASFRANNAVSRTQESTRFAVGFMVQDIRMAGYAVCTEGASQRNFLNKESDLYAHSIENAVHGWEYEGTDIGETYDLAYTEISTQTANEDDVIDAAREANAGDADDWSGSVPSFTNAADPNTIALPPSIAGLNPLRGSDIIAVSISEPKSYSVNDFNDRRQLTINLVDSQDNPIESEIETGQVVKVGDCSGFDIFQNSAGTEDTFLTVEDDPATSNVNATFRWQKKWGTASSIFTVETRVYFVGTGASGLPSLFMFSSNCGSNLDCPEATAIELVDGVENLQVLYGEDTDDDDVVDRFLSADQVTDFANVSTVKLGLLMRSPSNARDTVDDGTFDLIDNITINPPDGLFLRSVNNATIKINNKGL